MDLPLIFDRGSSQHRLYRLAGFGLLAVLAIVLWLTLPAFQITRTNRMLSMAVAILGLNLVVGYSGLLALCQSAFIAIGAFTTATLIVDHGWDYWMTIPFAMLAAFLVGCLLGVPALKIKGLYLAMATVAFAAAAPTLAKLELPLFPGDDLSIADRTGGANGRDLAEKAGLGEKLDPTWFPFFETEPARYRFIFVALLAIAAFWLVGNLVKSRAGRAVISIRDNEIGAAVSGVNLRRFKVLNFGISAALGGLAGVMWAMNSGFVAEQDFLFVLMVDLLVGLVVGGVGTVSGALIGAIVVVFGRWLCQTYFDYSSLSLIAWGVLIAGAAILVRKVDSGMLRTIAAAGAGLIGLFLLLPMLGLNTFGPLQGLGIRSLAEVEVDGVATLSFGWRLVLAVFVLVLIVGMLALAVLGATRNSERLARYGAFTGIVAGVGALGVWLWDVLGVQPGLWSGGDQDPVVDGILPGLYQLNGDGPLSQAIFGIVLIVVVFFAPQGIVGAFRKIWSQVVQIRPVAPELPEGITSISADMAPVSH